MRDDEEFICHWQKMEPKEIKTTERIEKMKRKNRAYYGNIYEYIFMNCKLFLVCFINICFTKKKKRKSGERVRKTENSNNIWSIHRLTFSLTIFILILLYGSTWKKKTFFYFSQTFLVYTSSSYFWKKALFRPLPFLFRYSLKKNTMTMKYTHKNNFTCLHFYLFL